MKKTKSLLKIILSLSVGLTLTVGFITSRKITHTKVEAAQYLENYDPYTYNGSYYNTINFDAAGGMNGALRQSLTALIKPAGFYTYSSSGETHLSTQLQYADEDPTNSSNMIYFYTRNSVTKTAATVGSTIKWNREHVWCQSLSNGNWGTSEGGTDILHLRPTYESTNKSRGNTPYGETGHATKKTYNQMDFGWTGNGYFEPLDSVKGDVARIIMYMWTTYTGYSGYSALNILSVFQSYDTLLKWHTEDKPDALEGNRNDYCQTSRQKNRNPFVDHPELGWKIFGDNASANVKNACMAAYPANGSGGDLIEPTGIRLNKSFASIEEGKTLQLSATLQPNGATGSISWSTSNQSVALVNSNGLVTAVNEGNATITATVGSFSASCNIVVTTLVNNYGTLENPLNITDAKEVIDITGTNETAQPLYVRGIVSSNTAFNTTYNNYDAVWLQSDDGSESEAIKLGRVKLDQSILEDYSAVDSMQGLEAVAYGYGMIYNGTYELWTSSNAPQNPLILTINAPTATGVSLNSYSEEIEVGDTITLTATLTPSNSTSPCTWESSDEDIVTVENGVVTGVSAGTAIITVRVSEDIDAECEITVIDNSSLPSGNETINLAENHTATATENEISWVINNVCSIVCNKESSTTNANNYYGGDANNRTSTRFYKNSVLSIIPAAGIEITSIVFTATTESYGTALKDSDWSNASANIQGTVVTVTPTNGASEFSVIIGATCGFTSISVSYGQNELHVNDYLTSATSIATLHGRENTSIQDGTDRIQFSERSLNNDTQYSSPFQGDNEKFTVTFVGGGNDGKYYTTGSGIRTYGDGSIVVASSHTLTSITFTWSTSYKPSDNVANIGTYDSSTCIWTGSSNSVTLTRPSGSGHWRLQRVEVSYTGFVVESVDQIALRFGATLSKDSWDAINDHDGWQITDYGVMLMKEADLAGYSSVQDAFDKEASSSILKIINKCAGGAEYADPYLDGDNYLFTVKVSFPNNTEYYDDIIYAVPFIKVNDDYYFLDEMHTSVEELADDYYGTDYEYLSNDALAILKGN